MKIYTKMLKEVLGTIIYGVAKTHDENLLGVFEEANRILSALDHPAELFRGSEQKANKEET